MQPALNHRRHLFHDAQPAGHLGIGLDHIAHVAAEAEVKAMCDKLLANPVIESYRIEVA